MPSLSPEPEQLQAKVAEQQVQIRWLELRVKDLEIQLYGAKSEQRGGHEEDNNLQWEELMKDVRVLAPAAEAPPSLSLIHI